MGKNIEEKKSFLPWEVNRFERFKRILKGILNQSQPPTCKDLWNVPRTAS